MLYLVGNFLTHEEEKKMLKKFVKMLWLIKKNSAYVIYEWSPSDKIDQSLKLDRNRLIFMAIILGCDFCPNGVPGVGKETVMQLFEGK